MKEGVSVMVLLAPLFRPLFLLMVLDMLLFEVLESGHFLGL